MSTDRGRHRTESDPGRGRPTALAIVATVIFVVAVVVAIGVVVPRLTRSKPDDPAKPAAVAQPATRARPTEQAVPIPSQLATDYESLAAGVNAQIGMAFAPVGRPEAVEALGQWSDGPAWSTIKVPLSVALLRETGEGPVTSDIRAAITASDNAAAQAIWDQLGAHRTAAEKVEAVLATAGEAVEVNSEVTRPGFSASGQTQWSLADQARYLAHAACDPQAKPVLDLMGEIVTSQRWGLGNVDGARFKGGWGPGPDGRYLVRQYGLISGPHGDVAVAIAGVASSGGFADGTAVLSRISEWLGDHAAELPSGGCPAG